MAIQEPTFYLLKRRLDSRETPFILGRVVRHFQDPTSSYTPEDPSVVLPNLQSHILETVDHGVSLVAKTTKDTSLAAKLQGLLSLSASESGENHVTVESPFVTTRRLKDLDTVWAALKADTSVKSKIANMVSQNGKAYLAIGIMTLRVGNIQRTGMRKSEKNATVNVPVGDAVAASTGLVGGKLPGGNIEIGASHGNAVDWSMSGGVGTEEGGAVEEEIFAIEYKVLKRNLAGFGSDIKVRNKGPDYKGGTTFSGKEEDDEEDEEEEDDEDGNMSEATLENVVVSSEEFFSGSVIQGQRPHVDRESRLVYYS